MKKRRPKQKPDAWMPWFIGDYLRDTGHLSTEQHGAYMLLLGAMWISGGKLPNDDAKLASICRLSLRRWRTHKDTLFEFFRISDSFIFQKRLGDELEHAWAVWEARVSSSKAKQNNRLDNEPGLFEDDRTEHRTDDHTDVHMDTERRPPPPPPPPGSPNNNASGEIPGGTLSQRARASARKVCKDLAKQGVEITTLDAHLAAALQEGFTADEILALARTRKGSGKPMSYLLQTLRGQRRDAQAQAGPPAPVATQVDPELVQLREEREQLIGVIYDARHAHDKLQSITAQERDQRIRDANKRIAEVEAAMEKLGEVL